MKELSKENKPENKLVPISTELESPETTSDLRAKLRALEEEEAALDLELKREKVRKIREERQSKLDDMKSRQDSIRGMLEQRRRLQANCNHRKGGRGPGAVLNGQGMDSQYAVCRHVLPSGRLLIICQRCGQEEYSRDPISGMPATDQYERFANFPTDNQTSGSSLFIKQGA